ncbi:ubiquinol-cytochrome C chaperone family protein [Tsuneonella aeria]|nr:ubiquinol-cytochrome C chaperone family protein [Tsuneonella aeria]
MSLLSRIFPKAFSAAPDPREALRPAWHAVVAAARQPEWYRAGVADTIDGRFDMVTAILAAVLLRLERAEGLAQEQVYLTELFVEDMDGQLREFGVGDVVVGKRVGKLMSALGGRLSAYRQAAAGDAGAMIEAVERNMTLRDDAEIARVAEGLRAFSQRLEAVPEADVLAGRFA